MIIRYALFTPLNQFSELFEVEQRPNWPARWNIAPAQTVAIVRRVDGQRELALVQWGLVPAWSRDRRQAIANFAARAETLEVASAFRGLLDRRRCLVLADGYYEWERVDRQRRQPWYVCRADRQPFAFAGLWDAWTDPNSGAVLESCVIVTTQANGLLLPIANRMPAILGAEQWGDWLADAPPRLLYTPCPADWLMRYPVGARATETDDPALIEPLGAPVTLN